MKKKESIRDKANRLRDTIMSASDKITAASTAYETSSSLICVEEGVLDFDRLENDVNRIHQKIESGKGTVLKSHLFLDSSENRMEIRTYIQEGEDTFLEKVSTSVSEIKNGPADIRECLQKEGTVDIQLTL